MVNAIAITYMAIFAVVLLWVFTEAMKNIYRLIEEVNKTLTKICRMIEDGKE